MFCSSLVFYTFNYSWHSVFFGQQNVQVNPIQYLSFSIYKNIKILCAVDNINVIKMSLIYEHCRVAMRDFKRMESTSRSPVLSFVTTTVQGLHTIHAFKKEKNFIKK